jgi:5-methyltetrahydropteroyltriglutamate--homocysteine methyltransferase
MGHHYVRKPIIKRKLTWTGPMSVDSWLFAARLTKRPVKAVVTGPGTLVDGSFDEYYPNRAAAVKDLIPIIRKEILALIDNGAKIIQIDEPALSARPEEFTMFADALRDLTKGVKAYFILRHHFGDLAPIWNKLGQLPVHQFSFAGVNSDFDVLPLFKKKPLAQDIALGVIDADPAHAETVNGVTDRIKKILKTIPTKQLWISSDGGLKTLPVKDASDKLRILTTATKKIRPFRRPIS